VLVVFLCGGYMTLKNYWGLFTRDDGGSHPVKKSHKAFTKLSLPRPHLNEEKILYKRLF